MCQTQQLLTALRVQIGIMIKLWTSGTKMVGTQDIQLNHKKLQQVNFHHVLVILAIKMLMHSSSNTLVHKMELELLQMMLLKSSLQI